MFAAVPPEPVRQVVLVSAQGWRSHEATLRRFQRKAGTWHQVGTSTHAWLGSNGLAAHRTRQQNSGQTPAGVFSLPQAFGAVAGGQVRLPYLRITPHSYWPYDPRDPRTYNVLQTRRVAGLQTPNGVTTGSGPSGWRRTAVSTGTRWSSATTCPARPTGTAPGNGAQQRPPVRTRVAGSSCMWIAAVRPPDVLPSAQGRCEPRSRGWTRQPIHGS